MKSAVRRFRNFVLGEAVNILEKSDSLRIKSDASHKKGARIDTVHMERLLISATLFLLMGLHYSNTNFGADLIIT